MRATTNCSIDLRSVPKKGAAGSAVTLPGGTLVTVEKAQGKWLLVKAPDGASGYLPRRSVCLEDKGHLELSQVLLGELEAVTAARPHPFPEDEQRLLKTQREEQKLERERLTGYLQPEQRKRKEYLDVLPLLHLAKLKALCLSGGGIRSATFNLGVLQGLAKLGVLKEMDYLSTVSGGGYIGSWLSSSVTWQKDASAAAALEKFSRVLAEQEPPAREPYQIRFLRDYSNYLTPRVGILSLDTWAVIGTYLRNLLLNWLVLLPLFFAVLLLPRILAHFASGDVVTALAQAGAPRSVDGATLALLFAAAGGILAIFPIAHTVNNLPSVNNFKQSKLRFMLCFLLPLFCMALVLSAYWGYRYGPGCAGPAFWPFVGFGAAAHLLGFAVAVICPFMKAECREQGRKEGRAKKLVRLALAFFCSGATGAVAGALGWVVAAKLMPPALAGVPFPKLLFVTLSVPAILGIYLLTMTLVVALLSRWTGEHDREWWGRAAGVVMLAAVVWGAGMAVVVYGPWFLLPGARGFWQYLYAAAGGISGIVAAKLGRDPSTPALRPGVSMSTYRTTLLSVAAALFLVFLGQALSLLTSWLLWLVQHPYSAAPRCLPFPVPPGPPAPAGNIPEPRFDFDWHLYLVDHGDIYTLWGMLAASALLCLLMSWMVDINKFSMHAMYRNRLVRCYLGGARREGEREQNPFTGFDRGDDLRMAELARRPFHVVNMAWNMVKGNRLAWQQRKAASFTMSPLFAGSDIDADIHRGSGREPGGYRPVGEYAKGDKEKPQIKLGTAMAISGAAASPNMGYHSSTLVAFVMAFFNVRLGWWLGNTGTCMGDAWRKRKSVFSLIPLMKETFGFTNEGSRDIYLSDGGHFENLGLYEMVRRRCRYIVACDAGCDSESSFEDLGNAVRKVRADFQIEIDIDLAAIRARRLHFAVGELNYRCSDGGEAENGKLLYLKPVLTGDESADLFNYDKMHDEFPHEPTSDQWFDEAQFESYRKLGAHSLEFLREKHELTLEKLFEKAEKLHRHELQKVHDHCSTR